MSLLNTILPSFGRAETTDTQTTIRPQYRVSQTPEAFNVKVYLPGVAKDGVEVTAEDSVVKIVGRRAWAKPQDWTALYSESSNASFELVLTHENEVNADGIQAELVDGVLTVSIPKSEAAKPRKIQVS